MAKLLLLSNGHGEDLSAALLGVALKKKGHLVDAFPLVGVGKAFKNAGIQRYGLKKEFSTGGLGYTSLFGRFTELIQGQLFYLLWNFFQIGALARKYDLLVVVGDVVPTLAAWLSRKKLVVYLVAYSSHYEGNLVLPWPASHCLRSKNCLGVFTRDQFTANDLTKKFGKSVSFLGNPFMDPVLTPRNQLPKTLFRLGLLPGSRRPELDNNLIMVLRVLKYLPKEILNNSEYSFDMALVPALDQPDFIKIVTEDGWQCISHSVKDNVTILENGLCRVNVHRHAFVELLQSSDAFLGMAGTAIEQAIGLAKPVVQLPGKGPQFTPVFAEAQRRLLGSSVFCAESCLTKNPNIFLDTANLVLKIIHLLDKDLELKKLCAREAALRLGRKGGSERLASSINHLISLHNLH